MTLDDLLIGPIGHMLKGSVAPAATAAPSPASPSTVPTVLGVPWSDALTAVGTVGAFAVALLIFGLDRRAQARDRRLAQARLVSAWLRDTLEPKPGEREFYEVIIRVRNRREEPVYWVSIKVPVGVRGTFIRSPGTLGPGEAREFSIQVPGYPRGVPFPEIFFVDSAGRSWLRDATGRLRELANGLLGADFKEDAGAYQSIENHPTINLGHSREEQQGKPVADADG